MCAECRAKYITNDNLESTTRRKSKCGNGSQLEKSKSLGTNVNGVQYHLVLYSESFHKYILFFWYDDTKEVLLCQRDNWILRMIFAMNFTNG